jgi:hypothetical protein
LRCEFELLPPSLIAIEVLNLPSVTGYILRIRSREPGMPFQRVRLIDTFAATGLKAKRIGLDRVLFFDAFSFTANLVFS